MKISIIFIFLSISGWSIAAPLKFREGTSDVEMEQTRADIANKHGAAVQLMSTNKHTEFDGLGRTSTRGNENTKARTKKERERERKERERARKERKAFENFEKERKQREKGRNALMGKCGGMKNRTARQACYDSVGDGAEADIFAEKAFKLRNKRPNKDRFGQGLDALDAARFDLLRQKAMRKLSKDVGTLFRGVAEDFKKIGGNNRVKGNKGHQKKSRTRVDSKNGSQM